MNNERKKLNDINFNLYMVFNLFDLHLYYLMWIVVSL